MLPTELKSSRGHRSETYLSICYYMSYIHQASLRHFFSFLPPKSLSALQGCERLSFPFSEQNGIASAHCSPNQWHCDTPDYLHLHSKPCLKVFRVGWVVGALWLAKVFMGHPVEQLAWDTEGCFACLTCSLLIPGGTVLIILKPVYIYVRNVTGDELAMFLQVSTCIIMIIWK